MQNIKQKRSSLNSHHTPTILKLKTSEVDCQRGLIIASTFEITSFLSGYLLFSTSKLYCSSIYCQRLLNYKIRRHSQNANHKHLFGTHYADIQRQINLQNKKEINKYDSHSSERAQEFYSIQKWGKKLKAEYIDKNEWSKTTKAIALTVTLTPVSLVSTWLGSDAAKRFEPFIIDQGNQGFAVIINGYAYADAEAQNPAYEGDTGIG